jgi:hypothetical protein
MPDTSNMQGDTLPFHTRETLIAILARPSQLGEVRVVPVAARRGFPIFRFAPVPFLFFSVPSVFSGTMGLVSLMALRASNVASLPSFYRGLDYGCIHLLVGVIDPNANLKFLFLVFCQQVVPLPGIAYDLGPKLIDSATCGQKPGFDSFHLIRTGPN